MGSGQMGGELRAPRGRGLSCGGGEGAGGTTHGRGLVVVVLGGSRLRVRRRQGRYRDKLVRRLAARELVLAGEVHGDGRRGCRRRRRRRCVGCWRRRRGPLCCDDGGGGWLVGGWVKVCGSGSWELLLSIEIYNTSSRESSAGPVVQIIELPSGYVCIIIYRRQNGWAAKAGRRIRPWREKLVCWRGGRKERKN